MYFDLPLHLSDRGYLSLSTTLHIYHSIKIMNAQEPSPTSVLPGWSQRRSLCMWCDLHHCRDSPRNRRHDDIHTLFHDPFLNVSMWSDLLTKAQASGSTAEIPSLIGGTTTYTLCSTIRPLNRFMWSDLLNCRDSLHDRRDDDIRT